MKHEVLRALRPTVGKTEGPTTQFPGRYPIKLLSVASFPMVGHSFAMFQYAPATQTIGTLNDTYALRRSNIHQLLSVPSIPIVDHSPVLACTRLFQQFHPPVPLACSKSRRVFQHPPGSQTIGTLNDKYAFQVFQ